MKVLDCRRRSWSGCLSGFTGRRVIPTTAARLGLSTVDSIVRQLGGSVWLENRADGVGLIAIVTLPVVAAA